MSSEAAWRREFDALRAEREIARGEWRSAARGLADKMRDPLGLGAIVREHPVAATGVGAGIAGFVVNWLFRTLRGKLGGTGKSGKGASSQGSSVWMVLLRDAALSVAVPWVFRLLKEKLGWDGRTGLDADEREPDDEREGPVPAGAPREEAVAGASSTRTSQV